jgi:sirohydrochlorin cobaltochelatase
MIATKNIIDKRTPMPAAPMKYKEDGSVNWGTMWESFCVLAQEGGPPHRGEMLQVQNDPDVNSPTYRLAVTEIIRGIREVSGLNAAASAPGWIAVTCASEEMAQWLSEAIKQENVAAQATALTLFVPVGDYYSVKGEIKNVITVVAKTSHYWQEHLPSEVKQTLAWQVKLAHWQSRVKGWLTKKSA